MTASWRWQCGYLNCDDYTGGWIKQVFDIMTTDSGIIGGAPYSLKYGLYEGGQTFDATSDGDELATLDVLMSRSTAFAAAYTKYFNGLHAAGQNGPFAHFTDISGIPGTTGFHGFTWGLLEDAQQATSPKYSAAINYINATPCWWTNCSH
jgi:hypothetical protein